MIQLKYKKFMDKLQKLQNSFILRKYFVYIIVERKSVSLFIINEPVLTYFDKNCIHEDDDSQKLQERYRKYQDILKNLTMMSDALMRNVFKNRECTEYVLRTIMDRDDLKVTDQVIQKDYKNLQGRSAVLDCVACDAQGVRYDIEIQQDNEGASPKRARYHSGLMDMNTLEAGQDFENLPDSYVIFITKDDPLGDGLPAYHIDRKVRETQKDFADGAHMIYVNSKIQDDTKLGRLMHDLHCKNSGEMYSEVLAERFRELKESKEGVRYMCSEMDKIYNEGIIAGEQLGEQRGEQRGIEIGEMRAKKDAAQSLADMGLPAEQIAKAVKVSLLLAKQWISEEAELEK